jgi:hypothetical protein
MIARPIDIAKFTWLLFNDQLLRQGSVKEMMALPGHRYGLGVQTPPSSVDKDAFRSKTNNELKDMQLMGHSGSTSGFRSGALYVPELEAVFVGVAAADSWAGDDPSTSMLADLYLTQKSWRAGLPSGIDPYRPNPDCGTIVTTDCGTPYLIPFIVVLCILCIVVAVAAVVWYGQYRSKRRGPFSEALGDVPLSRSLT